MKKGRRGKERGGIRIIIACVLVCILSIGALALTIFFKEQPNKKNQTAQGRCALYGAVPKEQYLAPYTVQSGDTLLSIAKIQLGSTSRINEIIENNLDTYPTIATNPEIKVGWVLYLPPENFPVSIGKLSSSAGEIAVTTIDVAIENHIHEFIDRISADVNTRYIGSNVFDEGDCIVNISIDRKSLVVVKQEDLADMKDNDEIYMGDEVTFPSFNDKCMHGGLYPSEVLERYQVKLGDTLASITREHFGDLARVEEIRKINDDIYRNLKTDNFLEVGWDILLPPVWTDQVVSEHNQGQYFGVTGEFDSETDNKFTFKNYRFSTHSVPKAKSIAYLGKERFEQGDCVTVLYNFDGAVGIAPQNNKENTFLINDIVRVEERSGR